MAQQYVFVLNDGPYGNERAYNGLRLALSLLEKTDASARVFLIGDGAQCGVSQQDTPEGHYNVERMIRSIASRGEVAT